MQKKWWHEKCAYQIYPKSFNDTNNDGIGDIRGIISKLDYLKDLGIDIIWISPMYKSPMVDQGYDISDYYSIDPRFGTMEDMDDLIAEAKKRDMFILMDLVINHTSDKHEWFKKAIENPEGEYADYYYFKEGIGDNPPNNWRSYFGGSAWEKVPGSSKYYLHLFAKEQPDLNWENAKMRHELYKMINWWLEKGLAGFRIDAIINIKKDLSFQSFPADGADGLCSVHKMLAKAEGVGEFLSELKEETFDKYNALTVAELFDFKEGDLEKYIGDEGYFSTIFDFNHTVLDTSNKGWYDYHKVTANELRKAIFDSQRETQKIGFKANIIENHDLPRSVNTFLPENEINYHSITSLATTYFMLRGIPFIYQGQELGMTNVEMNSIDEYDDICTRDQYHLAMEAGLSSDEALGITFKRSRDNSRTPFHWNNSENAGFTKAVPWLKVNPNYKEINAEEQLKNPNSVLSYYKRLTNLRKHKDYTDVVTYGQFEPALEEYDNIIAYYRKSRDKTILVVNSFTSGAKEIILPIQKGNILLSNYDEIEISKNLIKMKPYESVIIECI